MSHHQSDSAHVLDQMNLSMKLLKDSLYGQPNQPEKKFDDARATPFIRTNKNTWGLAHEIDPSAQGGIPSLKDCPVPVISCIGTSRDGKSTLLNLYCNWLLQRGNISSKPFSPFIAKQSDEAVTNGIDFYHLKGHCLLLDCQGMQLEDAKYDHHLALITYLISDVIILTVRQRLDLQVFNNLLSVFSFLPEIPEEFRRKDKPQLIIRIKDFQNVADLKKDKDYLTKLIKKWLTRSDDQFDQIKKAFEQTFNIHPVATLAPRYDDENEEDQILDIHSKTFPGKNPTFIHACEKIFELSKGFKSSDLLTKGGLSQLIAKMRENKKIDYKKLDLYHNIASVEIIQYGNDLIIQHTCLVDEKLIEKMDGSRDAYNMWKERENLINAIEDNTLNVKFKDVTHDIKNLLAPNFAKFRKIVDDAMIKNQLLAEQRIKPHWEQFNKKYEGTTLSKMINGFVEIFIDKQIEFLNSLAGIDRNVADRYRALLDTEKRDLENKRKSITAKNNGHQIMLDRMIAGYNIDKSSITILTQIVQDMNVTNLKYNLTIEQIGNEIINKIRHDIETIYKDNNIVWCLQKDNQIVSLPQMEYNVEDTINECATYIDDGLITGKFEVICKKLISNRLNEIGFLRTVTYQSIPYIVFIEFKCSDCTYLMTKTFYEKRFSGIITPLMQTNKFIKITHHSPTSDHVPIHYVLEFKNMNDFTQREKKLRIESRMANDLLCDVLDFCVENALELV